MKKVLKIKRFTDSFTKLLNAVIQFYQYSGDLNKKTLVFKWSKLVEKSDL